MATFNTINDRLLPFRIVNEYDVVNFYALNDEGPAGLFVTPTAFDPDDTEGYGSDDVGASGTGTYSKRYNVKNLVAPSAAGDNKYAVLGVTLQTTTETDENGNLLKFNDPKKQEMGVVLKGESVNVLTKGILTLAKAAYTGTPAVGNVGVIDDSGAGKIKAVDASTVDDGVGGPASNEVLGKFLSDESSKHGGYAIFKLEL